MGRAEKGKNLFLTTAIILLVLSVVSGLISYFNNSGMKLSSVFIRTGLEGVLLYYIFKGKNWAKITMTILLSIVMTVLIAIVFNYSFDIMSIISIAVYAGSIYIIVFSPSVKAYLKSVNS